MMFKGPQINIYTSNLEAAKNFYEKLGFSISFTAVVDGTAVHHELVLDGFKLGVATRGSSMEIHGITAGDNSGCEIVFWTENTDLAIQYLIENGATLMSEAHNFLDNKLRSGWVRDLDGNPIQIVSKLK